MATRPGRRASDTRSPVVSAIRLNEWPVPCTRMFLPAATNRCSSPTDDGSLNRAAANVTFPAQFVRWMVILLSPGFEIGRTRLRPPGSSGSRRIDCKKTP